MAEPAAGPLAVGFLRAATGGWTVPVTVLLLICGVEMAVGLFAGRPKILPAGGLAGRTVGRQGRGAAGPPEAGSAPADNFSKLQNCGSFPGVSSSALQGE